MWRGIGVNSLLFGVLFLLHIIAARLDIDGAFRLVALLITVQVLFFGPVSVFFERACTPGMRKDINRRGALVSFPLALGLGWAYGDMTWSLPEWPLIFLAWSFVHVLADRRFGFLA